MGFHVRHLVFRRYRPLFSPIDLKAQIRNLDAGNKEKIPGVMNEHQMGGLKLAFLSSVF